MMDMAPEPWRPRRPPAPPSPPPPAASTAAAMPVAGQPAAVASGCCAIAAAFAASASRAPRHAPGFAGCTACSGGSPAQARPAAPPRHLPAAAHAGRGKRRRQRHRRRARRWRLGRRNCSRIWPCTNNFRRVRRSMASRASWRCASRWTMPGMYCRCRWSEARAIRIWMRRPLPGLRVRRHYRAFPPEITAQPSNLVIPLRFTLQ